MGGFPAAHASCIGRGVVIDGHCLSDAPLRARIISDHGTASQRFFHATLIRVNAPFDLGDRAPGVATDYFSVRGHSQLQIIAVRQLRIFCVIESRGILGTREGEIRS